MTDIEIYNEDCFKVLPLMLDKSVDCVLIDPPYNISVNKHSDIISNTQYTQEIKKAKLNEGYDFDKIKNEFIRVLRYVNLIIFCNKSQFKMYLDWIEENNFNWMLVCWHKQNPIPATMNTYLPDTEYIFHIWEKGHGIQGDFSSKSRYYITPIYHNKFRHPTVKPIGIICNLIKNATKENDLVLDCFAGTGTTGVACKQLNRNCIMYEINPIYVEIAKKRLSQKPLNENWGTNFTKSSADDFPMESLIADKREPNALQIGKDT